jgi:hypothetical protein
MKGSKRPIIRKSIIVTVLSFSAGTEAFEMKSFVKSSASSAPYPIGAMFDRCQEALFLGKTFEVSCGLFKGCSSSLDCRKYVQ